MSLDARGMFLFLRLKILLAEPSPPPLESATLWGWLRRDGGLSQKGSGDVLWLFGSSCCWRPGAGTPGNSGVSFVPRMATIPCPEASRGIARVMLGGVCLWLPHRTPRCGVREDRDGQEHYPG